MRRLGPGTWRSLFCGLALLGWGGAPLLAAETRFVPALSLSEEYNDNIFETSTGARTDWVTRVQPGALFTYRGGNATLDTSYNLDYRHYANKSRDDEINHNAGLKGVLTLWERFFTLEASDTFSRVPLDLARNTVQESLVVNQIDQNFATVSPYLTWRLGERNTLKTGYRYSDVRYWQSAGIDKRVQGAFAEGTRELTARLSATIGYAFLATSTAPGNYSEHSVSAGLRYQYTEHSFVFGGLGNSWVDFSAGSRTSNRTWNAGLTNDFGFLVATLESRVLYAEDPLTLSTRETHHSVKLDRHLERGALGVSAGYAEYVFTQTGELDRRSYALSGYLNHELAPSLNAALNVTADRVTAGRRSSTSTPPYHLVASLSLSYAFKDELSLGLSYTRVNYWEELFSAAGAIEANRGVLELRKSF